MAKTRLVLLLTLLCQFAFGQWNQQNSGTISTLTDVHFINQDTGVVSGINSVLKTFNGGQTWVKTGFNNCFLEGIAFSNDSCAFSVGYCLDSSKSVIISSKDYGATWNRKTLPYTSFLKGVYFVNSNLGYSVGSGGAILKTNDAGLSWTMLNSGTNQNLQSVYFVDSLNGTAVGGIGNPLILRTTNGGTTWTINDTIGTNALQSVFYPSINVGYIVGWDGQVFRTNDGGLNWTMKQSVQNHGDLDVFFINDSVGYIAGGNADSAYIKKTIDAGNSWQMYKTQVAQGMVAIYFATDEIGYCVGSDGLILKTTVAGELNIEDSENKIQLTIYPNPTSDYLYISNESFQEKLILDIIDLKGIIQMQNVEFENNITVDLRSLSSQYYIIVIRTNSNIYTTKILKI